MSVQTFKQKVQTGAGGLMIPLAVYLVYYTYESFDRFISRSFTHPEFWENHWMIDEGVKLGLNTRMMYFFNWMPTIIVSIISICFGLHLLNRLRKGLFFDLRTAWAVQMLGGVSILVIILDTVAETMAATLITSQNVDGGWPLRYQYDPTDIKSLILCLVIFMFGWIMREAMAIDQEHKEYV